LDFHLDVDKAIQATGVVLRTTPGERMNYMRLLKLLYIVDREWLAETGRPITGDRVVATRRGPVLSRVYDLIKGEHVATPRWAEFLRTDGYHALLVREPGVTALSRPEIAKLREVSERYRNQDEFDRVDITHEFPEWVRNNPGNSCRPIPVEHILEAVGRQADLKAIEQDERDRVAFDALFGSRR
jgi:uncharacterized phage-associated protein